jgi:hypothetical protein
MRGSFAQVALVSCPIFDQGHGLSVVPPTENSDAQLFAQTRTLRIRQMDGLELSTVKLDLAAPDRCDLTLSNFHKIPSARFAASVALGILQTPQRFRTKRQLWSTSGFAIETRSRADHRQLECL